MLASLTARFFHTLTTGLLVPSLLLAPLSPRPVAPSQPISRAQAGPAADASALEFSLRDSLLTDLDGDGQAGAGDTLRYSMTLTNPGPDELTGVRIQDALSDLLTLIPGTLESTPLGYPAAYTVNEDTSLSLTLSGHDPDGDPLTYSVTDTSGLSGTLDTLTGPSLVFTPDANFLGLTGFTFQVCDNAIPVQCASSTVSIDVAPVNDAPGFTAGGEVTVLEDAGPHTVAGWATGITAGPADEIGQALTFVLSGNTNPDLFSAAPAISSTGTLTFTPAGDAFGSATVAVRLQDDGGTADGGVDTSAVQTLTINVTPVNDAPSFAVSAEDLSITVNEDSTQFSQLDWATSISPGPSNESSQSLTFAVSSNTNSGLFAMDGAPAVSTAGTLTFTPAAGAVGSATIQLILRDNGGTGSGGADTSLAQSLVVTVQDVNDAPSFTIGEDVTVNEDSGAFSLADWATAISVGPAEEAGQTVSFEITGNTNSGLFSAAPAVSANGTLSFAPADDANGSAVIKLRVKDNGGTANGGVDASLEQSFEISVNVVNDAPSFISGGDVSVIEDAGPQTRTGWMSAISAGPANESGQTVAFAVSFTNPTLFSADPAVDEAGTLTFAARPDTSGVSQVTLSLSDNGGTDFGGDDTSDPQTFQISVSSVNDAPSFIKGEDVTVDEDSGVFTLSNWATAISAGPTGESGQTLTFEITANDSPTLFSAGPAVSADGTLTFTPALNANGSATVTLRLTDSGGTADGGVDASAEQTFQISVTSVNDVPSFIKGEDVTVDEDSGVFTLSEWATAISAGPTGESGQTLTFEITANDSPTLFSAGPAVSADGTLTFTPALNANGIAVIKLRVTDSGGTANGGVDASAEQTFQIILSPINDAPTLSADSFTIPENLADGENVGTVTGVEVDTGQTLTYSITAGNTGSVFKIDADSGQITVYDTTKLDYETVPAHKFTLTVKVQDDQTPALSATANFVVTLTDVNEAPVAGGDSYDTIGNTLLEVDPDTAASQPAPVIFVSGSLLDNDSDPEGDAMTAALVSKTAGAQVTVNGDGSFTYVPAPGATLSDTFTYKVSSAGELSDTGTVTINLTGQVWYVKNDADEGGTGRSTDPFDTLVEAQTASSADDTIYVYTGAGTTTGQNTGITLKSGQRLIGAGVALSVPVAVNGGSSPTQLLGAGAKPKIGNTAGPAVTLSSPLGVTVSGLDISASGYGVNYSGNANGSVTLTQNLIHDVGQTGIYLESTVNGQVNAVITDTTFTAITGKSIHVKRVGSGSPSLNLANLNMVGTQGALAVEGGGGITVTAFSGLTVSTVSGGPAMALSSVVFDSTPGGAFQTVAAGTLTIGPSNISGAGLSITNAQGDLSFSALNIGTSSGAALTASSPTAYTGSAGLRLTSTNPATTSIAAVGGAALDLTLVSIDLQASKLTCSGNNTTRGIWLDRVTGSLNHTNASDSDSIQSVTGTDFYVNGGIGDLTYKGAITNTNGRSVEITGRTSGTPSGTITLAGLITDNGAGINLTNNTGTGATILFTGGLTLNTGTNPAFTATQSGTLTVSGANNTITTTTGQPLNVQNTTIAAAGLTFKSISSNGAAKGIQVENTESLGGFKITGTTGSAGSGGTLQNISGDGISLKSTVNAELNWINLTSTARTAPNPVLCPTNPAVGCSAAVKLSNVNGAVLNQLNITNTGDGLFELPILLDNVLGKVRLTNLTLNGIEDNAVRVYQSTGSAELTLSQVSMTNSRDTAEDGLRVLATGTATLKVLLDSVTITTMRGDGIDAAASGTANLHLTVQNSNISGSKGLGVQVAAAQDSGVWVKLDNNQITNSRYTAVSLVGYGAASILQGTVTNNILTHAAVGEHLGQGIRVLREEASTVTVAITGNTIQNTGLEGIYAKSEESTSPSPSGKPLSITVLDNTVTAPEDTYAAGMVVHTQGGAANLCLNVVDTTQPGKNTISAATTVPAVYIQSDPGSTFQVQGLADGSISGAVTLLNNQITSSPLSAASANPTFTPFAGVCATPDVPTLPTAAVSGAPVAAAGARAPGLAALLRPARTLAGETLLVDIPRLPVNSELTITFDVRVSSALPAGTEQVSNQARVSADEGGLLLSDDPDSPEPADATRTPLYTAPLATADSYSTSEDTLLSVAAPGLLDNDWRAPGKTLTAHLEQAPARGTLALQPDGSFVYTPALDDNGTVTFRYQADDGLERSAPSLVTIELTPVNDAPRLDSSGEMTLNSIVVNDGSPAGTGVAALLASAGGDRISDPDNDALEGIAVVALDSAHGAWQYSIDNGAAWQPFGAVSEGAARLLAADTLTRVRFVPSPDWSGTLTAGLTFRAWDRTAGQNGQTAAASTTGGTSPFSTALETVAVTVLSHSDLSLAAIQVDEQVVAGAVVEAAFPITNHGPAPVSDLSLTVSLPDGLTFESASQPCSVAAGTVTCAVGSLPAGDSQTVSLSVRIDPGISGLRTLSGSVSSAQPDEQPANNSASASILVNGTVSVYVQPEDPGEEWTEPIVTEPECGDTFLGEFSNQTVSLNLADLPPHSQVTVTFDLHILRSWDGNARYWPAGAPNRAATGPIGPDLWELRTGQTLLLSTTFSNWEDQSFRQAYPGSAATGDYPPRTGALSSDSMCYRYFGLGMDTTYRISVPFDHTGSDLQLDFSAMGLQDITDESWGLSNVQVSLTRGQGPNPVRIYLPALMR